MSLDIPCFNHVAITNMAPAVLLETWILRGLYISETTNACLLCFPFSVATEQLMISFSL